MFYLIVGTLFCHPDRLQYPAPFTVRRTLLRDVRSLAVILKTETQSHKHHYWQRSCWWQV